MASVSSLDQDMRKLRLDRYTPQAAEEAISWIESILGERSDNQDLLTMLKDGSILCRLANLVLPPPGIRFKTSAMPFTQRENIALFLEICERPPLSLPAHDRFLTVDLYDEKDPAQVLQCLGAFSRVANRIKPNVFQTTIGPKRAGGGAVGSLESAYSGGKGFNVPISEAGYGLRSSSPTKFSKAPFTATKDPNKSSARNNFPAGAGGGVSSWTKPSDEYTTAPAWNIHQYGYMGGANQGNQGIAFGTRRQIVAPAVNVPSREENVRLRQEREVLEQADSQEIERRQLEKREADEARAREEEQHRWEDETRKLREREAREAEEAQIRMDQYGQRRQQEDEARRREEERERQRQEEAARTAEQQRIRDLERQLVEAKAKERQNQLRPLEVENTVSSPVHKIPVESNARDQNSWDGDERESLRKQWTTNQGNPIAQHPLSGLSTATSSRPLPLPRTPEQPAKQSGSSRSSPQARAEPLSGPTTKPQPTPPARATGSPAVASPISRGMSTPKKYGVSLLEREMERERARQREWEENQIKKMKGAGNK